jgi:hypothetical protein
VLLQQRRLRKKGLLEHSDLGREHADRTQGVRAAGLGQDAPQDLLG